MGAISRLRRNRYIVLCNGLLKTSSCLQTFALVNTTYSTTVAGALSFERKVDKLLHH